MEKNIKMNRKNERGAITLFVLIACLFFALILTGVYVSTLNKMQAQEQQVDQIQENYARQLENIDEIYEELSKNLQVQLTQEPGNGTWTQEVILTGIGKIEKGKDTTIVGYAFSKNSEDESKLSWNNLNNVTETTQTMKVTEGGTYYFWIKDSEGEIYQSNPVEVKNIDRTAPTVGSIVAKEENAEGEEYDLTKSPWTDKSVYVEKVDGTDGESGHAETTYTVKKDGITIYENIKDPVTLEESGIYQIVVTTKDKAGNEATSKTYEIKIDKVVPVLALKHNDENGQNYDGTWTKDDLYGEVNIDTSKTGKSVEKYQCSSNGVIWNDISSEIVPTSIDYTTTFPMSEDKPDWFNGPVNNGDYYFEEQEDGTLKSNNNGVNNKTANSYFEIDLTDYSEAELQITINTTISSENNYDFGYATLTTSETAPAYNSQAGRFIYVSGTTKTEEYTTTLEGGQKYYLHIGYRKDSSGSSNQDTFIINSIRLQSETLGSGINFAEYKKEGNKVTFKLQEEIEKEMYIRAVYTDGTTSKYGDKTTIKIDKTAPIIESANPAILSRTEAKAEIKVKEEASGMKGYYISTDNIEPTEGSNWVEQSLKEFTIEGLKTETTYYLWIIDNVGNISEKQEIVIGKANYQVDGNAITETLEEAIEKASDGSIIELLNDYTDTSTATFSKNITFDVQGYTLTRAQTITINSGKQVEITGTGKITSGTNSVRTITNRGTLTISNSITIENMSTSSSNAPIYTNNNSVTNINDNVQIIGNYRGIYHYYGTVNVNGGKIEATYQGSSAYGIYSSSSSSKIYMNNGEIKGYYGIYNNGLLELVNGKIIGIGAQGIYSYGTTNIYGGRIEGKTYGVYSSGTDKVTIGREEDELSTTQPAIYGGNYGIYMSNKTYSFNFYNGVIISNTKETAYRGQANLRTGHMTYTYIDYEVEQKYCTILTPTVGNIEMKAEPTEYTNQNVTVTIIYPYTQGITREYSEDGTEWKQAEEYVQEVLVEENKTIYARTINESGVITEEKQIEVTNIDKEKPTVEVTPTQTKYTVIETDGTVDLNITIKAQDTGVSGLDKVQYAWIEAGDTPNYMDFTNEVTINKENLKIGTYYLYINVTDKAGNKADIEQIRYTVEYQDPVAQIGNTKYLTIQEAIEACSKTAGETQTTIEILKSTDEEFSTYEGQNIKIDLKGKTIGSSNTNTPICTNNGTLQIVDTSTEKTGKLESLNGTAIENKGTLTIGDNSTEIEMEVPTIYGKQIGIKNEGIFNFYDGKIQGTAPIQGNVTNTPAEYGPVSTNYENGITTIQLGVVSGYEARIEWVYYTTVQGAIDATKLYDSGYKDTVTIIKDIQLKEILEINMAKDMILDLNGYELTIFDKEAVINNYGKFELTDSDNEKKGTIKIETNFTGTSSITTGIYNIGQATTTINSGNIISKTSNNAPSYGIYNEQNGTITIKEGNIISENTGTGRGYGIRNNSDGNIIMDGGKITGKTYGIYNNNSKGTIYKNNGDIISATGIYNQRGYVEVNGGNINKDTVGYGGINNSNGRVIVNSGNIYVEAWDYGIRNASGEVTINGGNIFAESVSRTYIIHNTSKANTTINGGYIQGNGDRVYGVYSTGTSNVIMTGGSIEINSNSALTYGIENYGSGIVTITGGTIQMNNTGVSSNQYSGYSIANKNDGTIIIGDKNKEVSKDILLIAGNYTGTSSSGKSVGVYNEIGKLEFYNGTIQGNQALSGGFTKIRDGYEIKSEIVDGIEKIYLVEKTTEDIVQVDNIKYNSLQEAINSIEGEDKKTIQVIKDFELKEPVEFNKNIVLDLKGKVITDNFYAISNTKELEIIDSTEEKNGEINVINGMMAIKNSEYANLTVSGGNLYCSNEKHEFYGIYNADNANLCIKNGTIETQGVYGRTLNNQENGNIIIEGGNIISQSDAVFNKEIGNVTIKEGVINGSVYNYSSGIIEMLGGTINFTSQVVYGIYNRSTGTIKMSGGTISGYSSQGITNDSTGTVEITGGTINITYAGTTRALYNVSNGTIIIGTKGDGIVSESEPYIKGETSSGSNDGYGVYNTEGKLYYYDGKIEGTTKAVYDTITEREENTELNYNEDQTVLTLSTEITPIAQIGDITYDTIQAAIDACGTEQTTIKILRNATFTNNDTKIIVPNNKNIILDLNGYQITSSIPETLIQNEGILEIQDTSTEQDGILVSQTEKTINNISGAKLTVSGGTLENRRETVIYNQGELIVTGGNINSIVNNYERAYGIYNLENAILKIENGEINSTISNNLTSSYSIFSYGIYNESVEKVSITGSIINSKNDVAYNTLKEDDSVCYAIYNANTGDIEISNTTINSISNNYYNCNAYCYGIYNLSQGNIIVDNSTINNEITVIQHGKNNYSYGIYNNDTGRIEIISGKINNNSELKEYEYVETNNSYGIYNNTGTVVIGTKSDNQLLQEELIIQAKGNEIGTSKNRIGIYNVEGTLQYYDGIIKGIDKAIVGRINELEDLTEMIVSKETIDSQEYEVLTLEQKTTNAVKVNNTEYDSIEKAIQAIGNITGTIELLRDIGPKETIIIEEGQNITIDLKGYSIKNYTEIQNKGTLKIVDSSTEKNGKISNEYGIVISNIGTMTLESGGITDSGYGIKNTGTLNITGGNIANNTYGIYNDGNGTTTIKGGNINTNTYGVYNYNGTVGIEATVITNNDYGIYNAGGTTNVKEGAEVQSNIGIYNSNGTVNIGEQGTMNPDSPIVIGETYGLVNSPTGIIYMYDGQVRGKEGATQGYITYTESGYAVANKTEGEYNIDYLVLAGTVETVAEVNGIAFSNLQSAVNSVIGEEAQTVKLTNGVILNSTLHISEGQNIILDMNEKTISSNIDLTIQNEGNLTIIDSTSSGVGKITSTVGVAIENSGTLTLGQDDGTVSQDLITIEGTTYGIINSGTFNFYDGTINGASAIQGVITNRPEGYVIRITTVNGKERYYLSI